MTTAIPLAGQVRTTVLVNVRQGAPSIKAPIVRKLDKGTSLSVEALVTGDAVEQNAHWYRIASDSYVWSGGCTELVAASPSSSGSDGSASDPRIAKFGLDPTFGQKLVELLNRCAQSGFEFRISQGLRTPQTQALYYCQWAQRTPAMIESTAIKLDGLGAPWAASLLRFNKNVAREKGWKTSQLPGSGWHQWGEAADCYCYRDGQLVSRGNDPCYRQYAEMARDMGLTPGFYFKQQDSGHVQLRPEAGATDLFSWPDIDAQMKVRFADKPMVVS